MARPLKAGLDFMTIDVDMDTDEKIQLIEAVEPDAFGIIIRILMRIYRNGYYLEWSDKSEKLMSIACKKPVNVINNVVNVSINEGFFDKEVFEAYSVLTSAGIQKRFFGAISRRKIVNVYINLVIVDINSIIDNNNTHLVELMYTLVHREEKSRVKKSKEEKSKEEGAPSKNDIKEPPTNNVKESRDVEAPSKNDIKEPPTNNVKIFYDYRTKRFINITDDYRTRWKEAYPNVDVLSELRQMEIWADANRNKRKKNWRSFIAKWLNSNQKDSKPKNETPLEDRIRSQEEKHKRLGI